MMKKKSLMRLVALCLSVLMAMGTAAMAASSSYTEITGQQFSTVSELYGNLAIVRKGGNVGLYYGDGFYLVDPGKYAAITYLGETGDGSPCFQVTQNGKAGVIDRQGRLVVGCNYLAIEALYGDCIVGRTMEGKSLIRVSDGKVLSSGWEEIKAAEDGRSFVVARGGAYALVDADGATRVPLGQYETLEPVKGGFAVVKQAGQYGLVTAEGKLTVAVECAAISGPYGDGLFIVRKGAASGVVRGQSGGVIVPVQYDRIEGYDNGVFFAYSGGRLTVFGQEGRTLAASGQYTGGVGTTGNLVILQRADQRYGAIDAKTGDILIPFQFLRVGEAQFGLVQLFDDEGQMAVYNDKGACVLPAKDYGLVSIRADGTMQVTFSSGKWGLFDRDGDQILPYQYQSIGSYTGDYVVVSSEKGFAVLDRLGREVVPFGAYDSIAYTLSGRLATVRKNGSYGLIRLPAFVAPPSDWAAAEVELAQKAGLIPDEFSDLAYGEAVTREEFCKLAVNLIERKMGMEITDYIESLKATPDALGPAVSFTDTSDSDVEAAARLGIVNGRGNGRFDPQGTITRQEAAAMLYRTAAEVGVPLPEPGGALAFDDSHQIAEYARDGVLFVATTSDLVSGKKVMEGVGGNLFSPLAGYTREQAYLTILRLYRAA